MPRLANSDSEDSAPEILKLSSTKKESKSRAEAVNAFEAAQKAKRKSENRARDAALKQAKARAIEKRAQAEVEAVQKRKGQRRGTRLGEPKMTTAENRMERAMREAAGEEGSALDDSDEEEWTGIATSELDAEGVDAPNLTSSNHLPDHFFSAAVPRPSSPKASPTSTGKLEKKRHKRHKPKELIVGSRTLRTLSSPQADTLTASLTLPPTHINKFLDRALLLKGAQSESNPNKGRPGDTQKKGVLQKWERRPVNVGVLRSRDGPAMRFARER